MKSNKLYAVLVVLIVVVMLLASIQPVGASAQCRYLKQLVSSNSLIISANRNTISWAERLYAKRMMEGATLLQLMDSLNHQSAQARILIIDVTVAMKPINCK